MKKKGFRANASMTFPSRTASSIRLEPHAGQGMPRLGGSGKGDLMAEVNVVLPTKLSDKEKDLFQELKAIRT